MPRKICITTIYKNTNYGANLQAFALNKFINEYNECYLLSYEPQIKNAFSWIKNSWTNEKNKTLFRSLKLGVALLWSVPHLQKKIDGFNSFRNKYTKQSLLNKSEYEIADYGFTDIVCGSDQVWNPDITGGIKPLYFGDILGIKNKIAYAPSMGRDKYNTEDELKAAELIKNIDYVSVREEKSVGYIEKISGKKVINVCDPVFLLDKAEYEKIAKPIKIKKPYLLVYSVVGNATMLNAAIEFANQKGLTVVEICQNKKRGAKHIQLTSASPEEFLGAIKNAQYVVTNSFHGTAFSLIFNKELYVFDNKERGSRITGLLEKAGLENRINEEKIIEQESIDYSKIENNLKDYIACSKEFLLNAISANKEATAKNCVGCGACKAVCKKDSISLVKNKAGFIKSYIDINKCVNCGLCKKVCPTENTPIKEEPKKIYAFKAKDSLRKNSTSGGAFAALALRVLNMNGSVYGASLNNFKLKTIRITKSKEIALIQGTKYIQSNMTNVFEYLENDLKEEKIVLFTGTPCQVAAVKNYVKIKRLNSKKLYLCDIICHGVASVTAFENFIEWLKNKEKEDFNKYYFRNKDISWRGDSASIEIKNGLKRSKNISAFMNLYYCNYITDEACFNCNFTSKPRVSDITISDFWGIENTAAEFEDKLGVSMVMANTDKGQELFNELKGKQKEVTLDNAKQPQLKNPTSKPANYEEFWENFDIKKALLKYGAIKESLKTKLYKIIKGR